MLNQEPNPAKRRRQAAAKRRKARQAQRQKARQQTAARQRSRTAQSGQRTVSVQRPSQAGQTDGASASGTARQSNPTRKGSRTRQAGQTRQTTAQRERASRAQIRRLRAEQVGQQDQEERWNREGVPMWGRTLIAVAVVLLLLLVFFRVDRFEVVGNVHYAPEEVADASGITVGDVLMGVNKTQAASRILVKLPYIRQVVVSKVLPGTVRFTVVESQAMAAASSEFGTVWLLNADGKLLEALDNAEENAYPLIQGPVLNLPTPGDPAVFSDAQAGDLAMETVQWLTDAGVRDKVRIVDISDGDNIKLSYDDRIEVQLGDGTDLYYRIQYMILAMEQLGETARGTLDLTFRTGENGVFHPIAS